MTTGQQARSKPLKVIVLSPPIDRSGGIGTLFRYAREYFPPEVDVEFIDTRGYSKNPWSSAITLMRALVLVTWRRISGDVDVIHLNLGARGAAVRKLSLAAWITHVLRTPFVLQLHAATFGDFIESLPRPIGRIMIQTMNRAQRILVLGHVWRSLLINLGCSPEIVQVFVMGVPDLSANRPAEPANPVIIDPHYYILFAGEMSERKGLPHVIEALALPGAKSVRLIVAGSGEISPWRSITEQVGVRERVAFLGLVDPELIHTLMGLVDGMILPSRAEGLPVSVLEALSSGAVAICTTAGSLSEFITDDVDAIILESPAPVDIARGLIRAIELTQNVDISANASRLWSVKFNTETTSRELSAIWRDCSTGN